MLRVITFVRRIAGLLEPSLESEFYEEFIELSKYVELTVVSDNVDSPPQGFKIYKAWTIRIPKIYGLTKILSYCYAVVKHRKLIDIVYVRTFSPPEICALLFSKKFLNKKTLLLIPGTWIFEPPTFKNRMFRWIFEKTVYASDKIILYTPLMYEDIHRYFPRLDRKKVVYVHNGVNIERFSPREPDQKVLTRYSIPDNGKVLLYVGRVSYRKGVIDLVKAFKIIFEKYKDVFLVIAGSVDHGYGEQVMKLIKSYGLLNHVLLLGPVPNKDIVELMRRCDIFLYSSIGGEGIPRAILEAMACGRPVVATRVTGIPEAIRDGKTGYTVEVGDHVSFAQKVLGLLRDEALRRTLGENARKLIEKEFSYSHIIAELVRILKEVVYLQGGACN